MINDLDYLTQLGSKAAFDAALSKHFSRATPDQPAGLIMVDIDYFKKVNDRHGHQTGDAVLKELGLRLGQTINGKGFAYRYGGEEFAVILPNHTVDETVAAAERARLRVEQEKICTIAITSSFGVAIAPLHASETEQWLRKADQALYEAKDLGRNLVRLSGEVAPKMGQVRQPTRKLAEPGTLSDEMKERLRLQILRNGSASCPSDDIPLKALEDTQYGEAGRSFLVHCAGCGFHAHLPGPGR